MIIMRDYIQDFDDICKLMRNYMKHDQPQRFASVWGLFMKHKKTCDIYGINIQNVEDIYEYAKKEHIERFGFTS